MIFFNIKIGTHGHLVSNFLCNFFNEYYRTIENYRTKSSKYKKHKKNGFNSMHIIPPTKDNNSNNKLQLADTKIETILSKLKENNFEIIRNSFFLAEDEISAAKFDAQFSGSTCIIVFLLGSKILCANAGDSRAILVYESMRKQNNKYFSNFLFLI